MGVEATGEVGSKDPVDAVHDALRTHEVDEIILSTLPVRVSRWLGQDVPSKLRRSVARPGRGRHRARRSGARRRRPGAGEAGDTA